MQFITLMLLVLIMSTDINVLHKELHLQFRLYFDSMDQKISISLLSSARNSAISFFFFFFFFIFHICHHVADKKHLQLQ